MSIEIQNDDGTTRRLYDFLQDEPTAKLLKKMGRGTRIRASMDGKGAIYRLVGLDAVLENVEWAVEGEPARGYTHDALAAKLAMCSDVALVDSAPMPGEPLTYSIGSDSYTGMVIRCDYQKGGSPRCDWPMRVLYVRDRWPAPDGFRRDVRAGLYDDIEAGKISCDVATRRPIQKEQNRSVDDGPRYKEKGSKYGTLNFGFAVHHMDPHF